jgi:hypothetical protein
MKFKSEYYWFLIFAFCFFTFNQIQDHIRPNYNGQSIAIKYFLGIAPNFFPGIGLPALFVLIIPYFLKKNYPNSWFLKNKHLTANLISITGLVGWEFMQISGKMWFDWNDILWTFIGALLFQFIWTISPQKFKVH